jgi:hypothetical protein
MHNSHDALVLGSITGIERGVCTIAVAETIVSSYTAGGAPPAYLLEPETVTMRAADISFFGHEKRPPRHGDRVLISVNQAAGGLYTVANGAFLVSSLDKFDLSVVLPEDAAPGCLPVAAALECFVHSSGKIATFHFYQDIAVSYYMGKDRDFGKGIFIYYLGYEDITPHSPVLGSRLPHPGMDATYEVHNPGKNGADRGG